MALQVKDLVIGDGLPKIIVPVMAETTDAALLGIMEAADAQADCVELRADACPTLQANSPAEALAWVCSTAAAVEDLQPSMPVLFTLRSARQGGLANVNDKTYGEVVSCAIESGAFDLVDIEINQGDMLTKNLVRLARQHEVASVVSYHNFERTPSTEWMVSTITRMHDLGASIPKLAVMPQNKQDTLRLLAATEEVTGNRGINPVITMAMGPNGTLSRLVGEAFGSAMTFASLAQASAPGQVGIAQTRAVLQAVHTATAAG